MSVDIEHRQIEIIKIMSLNVIMSRIESQIIRATLGFKSIEDSLCTTIKGIEVMRALRKGQASSFYYMVNLRVKCV
jgi:IS6 family transposase